MLDTGDTQLILLECRKQGLLRNQAAYVLATAFWETARTMEPVREALASTDDQAMERLERAWQNGRLPWVTRPYWRDGFFGRGYVQLTHEANYARAGAFLGLDLVGNPSRALDPATAAVILVIGMRDGWFTGKKLADYITLQASDYVGARRIVNGTDKRHAIAELARDYEGALLADGYGVEPAPPVVNERRDGSAPRDTPVKSKTLLAQVMQWVGGVAPMGWAFFQSSDPMVQAALVGGGALVLISGGVIFRERLRYWAEGLR